MVLDRIEIRSADLVQKYVFSICCPGQKAILSLLENAG